MSFHVCIHAVDAHGSGDGLEGVPSAHLHQLLRGVSSGSVWIGYHHWASFLVAFPEQSPWLCSLQWGTKARIKKKKKKNKRAHLLLLFAISLISPRHRKDAEVVAKASGHLSGFAQRNLKHLNPFDHNLILEEAVLHAGEVWILWQALPRPHSSQGRLNGRITTRLHLVFALPKASKL